MQYGRGRKREGGMPRIIYDFNREAKKLKKEFRAREELKLRRGQANKGTRRMPWHWEPKKDVTSCEKLR